MHIPIHFSLVDLKAGMDLGLQLFGGQNGLYGHYRHRGGFRYDQIISRALNIDNTNKQLSPLFHPYESQSQ